MWVIVCISMRILRLKTRSSPIFGCFSKRQILASLSSFWWSKRRTEEKQAWRQGETGYLQYSWLSFAMIDFLNHLTRSWLQVSFDLVEGTAQVFGHRCQRQCGVCVIDIHTSVYLLALCQPGFFSLSELKCLTKIMWPDMCLVMCHKLAGNSPQQTVSSHSTFILTSCVAINVSRQCACRDFFFIALSTKIIARIAKI